MKWNEKNGKSWNTYTHSYTYNYNKYEQKKKCWNEIDVKSNEKRNLIDWCKHIKCFSFIFSSALFVCFTLFDSLEGIENFKHLYLYWVKKRIVKMILLWFICRKNNKIKAAFIFNKKMFDWFDLSSGKKYCL